MDINLSHLHELLKGPVYGCFEIRGWNRGNLSPLTLLLLLCFRLEIKDREVCNLIQKISI